MARVVTFARTLLYGEREEYIYMYREKRARPDDDCSDPFGKAVCSSLCAVDYILTRVEFG